jgi:glycosyltransferase involved in cell wall biosynthesis
MNLLVVSPFFPERSSGARARAYYSIKALTREHDVSLLVLKTSSGEKREPPPEELNLQKYAEVALDQGSRAKKRLTQLFWILRGRSPLLESYRFKEVQAELDKLFSERQYHIAVFHSALMAAEYRIPPSTRLVLDEHNIEYELLYRSYQRGGSFIRRWYNWWESHQVKRAELRRCSQSHGVLVTSEREASILKSSLPNTPVYVVPNGVDLEHFRDPHDLRKLDQHIVFTGSMDFYPNIDAVHHFARECWPLIRSEAPRATWTIVGRNPPYSVLKLQNIPGITVTGAVPDVRPYLGAAYVAIAPLRIGSGTRLKILEAFAMNKAVVSTSLGCEGLAVTAGKHLIVADQPKAFARHVLNLLQDPERRVALAKAGRDVAQGYSWEACSDALLGALREISNPCIRPQVPRTLVSS